MYTTSNTAWIQRTGTKCSRWRKVPSDMAPKNNKNWLCNMASSNKKKITCKTRQNRGVTFMKFL